MPWPTLLRSSRPAGHGERGPSYHPEKVVRPTTAATRAVAGVAGLLVLAACTSGSGSDPSSASSAAVTVLPGGEGDTSPTSVRVPASTAKRATSKPATSKPATSKRATRAPKKTGTTPPKPAKVREITRKCPYLSNDDEQIAEGKKVGRSTVLTTSPVGCRFYLAYPDYHAVAQITVRKYRTELIAFNTVARTGGSTAQSTPRVGDGAVLYRTRFYKADGNRDWACIFAKGKTVVTVHTDATMSSVDARNVAVAIVGKF
jgi:hypothetical protein